MLNSKDEPHSPLTPTQTSLTSIRRPINLNKQTCSPVQTSFAPQEHQKYNQNAYITKGTLPKKPKAYCPLSRKQAQSEQLEQIMMKGIDYYSSSEYMQFKELISRRGLSEQQILSRLKEARNNKVYLGQTEGNGVRTREGNCQCQLGQVVAKSGSKRKEDIKGDTLSLSIDQLSKIEEKDTLNLEYRLTVTQAESGKPIGILFSTNKDHMSGYELEPRFVCKERRDPIMIRDESEQTHRPIFYPQARRSPLHLRTQAIKSSTQKEQDGIQEKSFPRVQKKVKEHAVIPNRVKARDQERMKEKENINFQSKMQDKALKDYALKFNKNDKYQIHSDSSSSSPSSRQRAKKKNQQQSKDIYNIDFKLTKPTITTFTPTKTPSKKDNMLKSYKNFTPIKIKQHDRPQKTLRYLYNSKEHSEQCNRSVSKGKLSVVSASRRLH